MLTFSMWTMCCSMSMLMSANWSLLGYGAGPKGRVCPSFIQGWLIMAGIFNLSSGFDFSSCFSRSLQSKKAEVQDYLMACNFSVQIDSLTRR